VSDSSSTPQVHPVSAQYGLYLTEDFAHHPHKIDMVKFYRDMTGAGLRQSKDAVEAAYLDGTPLTTGTLFHCRAYLRQAADYDVQLYLWMERTRMPLSEALHIMSATVLSAATNAPFLDHTKEDGSYIHPDAIYKAFETITKALNVQQQPTQPQFNQRQAEGYLATRSCEKLGN
jgi:hypothetical protein